jgi:hypothetical protein
VQLAATDLKPSATRPPFFTGWDTSLASYTVPCPNCLASVEISFSTMLRGAWGWSERFSQDDAAAIRQFFGLGNSSLALPGGRPSISECQCGSCGSKFVFYADFDEPQHSVYSIVAQGLASVGP